MTPAFYAITRVLHADRGARVLIEAEVPTRGRDAFERNYRDATGENANDSECYRLVENKWGAELRLYVSAAPATIEGLAQHVVVTDNTGLHADEFPHRINHNDLVRWLFREGYVLGVSTPAEMAAA